MKQFRALVKEFYKNGATLIEPHFFKMQHFPADVKEEDLAGIADALVNGINRCEPFVFETGENTMLPDARPIDAPFPVFSMEFSTGFSSLAAADNSEIMVTIRCMMIIADYLDPGVHLAMALIQKDAYSDHAVYFAFEELSHVTFMLNKLNRGHLGVVERDTRISWKKPGNPKKKQGITKQRVFIVADQKKSEVGGHRDIQWSHRWNVRGHWRRVNGIGKNRLGEYCEQGRTWVTHSTKGPAGFPLINKKQHIVKENK